MKKSVHRKPALRKSFATNLRREREARGLSQEALSHDAGLPDRWSVANATFPSTTSNGWRGRWGLSRPTLYGADCADGAHTR